jgi:hypothetical protein
MASPIEIILEMIMLVFGNTAGTMGSLFSLFGSLLQSLVLISSLGTLGFLVAAAVLGIVLYFLGRFFLSSWKLLAGLFVAGLLVIWVLMAGAG